MSLQPVGNYYIIQRQHSRALYSIAGYDGRKNLLAFKSKSDASRFARMIKHVEGPIVFTQKNGDRLEKPRQPLVVQEYSKGGLDVTCCMYGMGLSIVDCTSELIS